MQEILQKEKNNFGRNFPPKKHLQNQQCSNLLVLCLSGDCEGVCGERGLDLWVVEVDHGSVVLDHVDLLDAGDRVHGELLQGGLELLVVGGGSAVDDLEKS